MSPPAIFNRILYSISMRSILNIKLKKNCWKIVQKSKQKQKQPTPIIQIQFVFWCKEKRNIGNFTAKLAFQWFDNFGKNPTSLQRNGCHCKKLQGKSGVRFTNIKILTLVSVRCAMFMPISFTSISGFLGFPQKKFIVAST